MDDLPIINFNDTPPLPSVVVPLRPIQLNYTQYILLDYISKLYKYLSSFEEFKKGVARFYIKGGAAKEDVFKMAENAVCVLPPKKGRTTRRNRRSSRRANRR